MTAREAISGSVRRRVMLEAGFRCHYCNRVGHSHTGPGERPWHIDHKVPVVKGGTSDLDNLVLACKRCNLTKSVRDYDEFRDYARIAYWVDDSECLALAELDALARTWTAVRPSLTFDNEEIALYCRREAIEIDSSSGWERERIEFGVATRDLGPDGGGGEYFRPLFEHEGFTRWNRDALAVADFASLAYRYMPHLLAMVAEARESRSLPEDKGARR